LHRSRDGDRAACRYISAGPIYFWAAGVNRPRQKVQFRPSSQQKKLKERNLRTNIWKSKVQYAQTCKAEWDWGIKRSCSCIYTDKNISLALMK